MLELLWLVPLAPLGGFLILAVAGARLRRGAVAAVGVLMNLAFYTLIFHYTPAIGVNSGWEKYQFFLFLSTGLLINSLVQALFMTNADELSELVRTGTLDFANPLTAIEQIRIGSAGMSGIQGY